MDERKYFCHLVFISGEITSVPILGPGAKGRGGEDSHGEYIEWQSINKFGRAAAAAATNTPESEYIQSQEKV